MRSASDYTFYLARICAVRLAAPLGLALALSLTASGLAGCGDDSDDRVLTKIVVAPADTSIVEGGTQQLTATGVFSDNKQEDLTERVSWSSSDESVVTVSGGGLVTAVAAGTATVTATLEGVSGSTEITVTTAAATLVSIAVSPATLSLTPGSIQQLTATGTYSDSSNADITDAVTWSSSDANVLTVSSAAGSEGLVTALAAGTATVTASLHGVSGSASATVATGVATLVSIAVTPGSASLAVPASTQLTATGTYSDSSNQDISGSVTWSSSDESVATVSNASGSMGLVTAVAQGSATITASLDGVSGDSAITVTNAQVVSIAITPDGPSVPTGGTQQLTAMGSFSDSTTQNLTIAVSWSSSDESVATVSDAAGSKGLATAVAVGSATITAALGSISGDTTFTVTPAALVSIAISPANPSLAKGAAEQLTATGSYSDSSTADLTTEVSWSSSDENMVTVSNDAGSEGLATAVAVGSATITATDGTVSGTTGITVTPVPEVLATIPADGAIGVPVSSTIAVQFADAMDALTLAAQTADGACAGTIQVSTDSFASCIGFSAAAPQLSTGDTLATLTPADPLSYGTTYLVRVITGAKNTAGNALPADYTSALGLTTEPPPAPCQGSVVISQVYGGGGNSGAYYKKDFIELHNLGSKPVDLTGWSVQYASATGNTWAVTQLSGTIPANGYYLIEQAAGSGGTAELPTPDATGTSAMGASSGKVALVTSTTALSGTCPSGGAIVDLVGFGTTASCFEGSGPTPAPSNTNAVLRKDFGCRDTGDNASDFSAEAPTPRNSASPVVACGAPCGNTANGTGAPGEVDWCILQWPTSLVLAPSAQSGDIYGQIFQDGITQPAGGHPSVIAQVGYGPDGVDPTSQSGWVFFPATFNLQDGNNDEYTGAFAAPTTEGSYRYTYRFSLDGSTWTYCDLDAAGANSGLSFDLAQLPLLIVGTP